MRIRRRRDRKRRRAAERRPSDRRGVDASAPRSPRAARRGKRRTQRRPRSSRRSGRNERRPAPPLPAVTVRFLPQPPALENVIAQIKSGSVAYSVFALARLFLEKPERYTCACTRRRDVSSINWGTRPGLDRSPIARSQRVRLREGRFYKSRSMQSEPIKGNFTNVARCRASGTLLGPTNHHSLSAAIAQSLRTALQPAHEFRGLSAADRNRERSGGGRAMEGTGAQHHHLHDQRVTSRRSLSILRAKRSGIFGSTHLPASCSRGAGIDNRRRLEPALAGSRPRSCDRKCLVARNPFALENDAGTRGSACGRPGSIFSGIGAGCFSFRRFGCDRSDTSDVGFAFNCRHSRSSYRDTAD